MTLFKRPILLTVSLLVIAAIVLIVVMRVSTNRALERAESFSSRRMLVTQQEADNTYRFFFVTNRSIADAGAEPEMQFDNQRGDQLHYGLFDTGIQPSLGIGMLINPTDWFQNEEIQLHTVRKLDLEKLVAEVSGQVAASPYRSLLININGFRERFPSALRKTAFLAHVLDINTPVLVFDWPGDQGSSPRGYRRAQHIARESAQDLAKTLQIVVAQIAPQRIWILGNSMGAEVVVNAFHAMYRAADLADSAPEIEHVFLTAPDVSYEEFGDQFEDELRALAEDLTVYVSSNDRALFMSRILNRGRRLGTSAVDPANPDQSDAALRTYELLKPGSNLVTLVDITPVNRTRNFHNFSLETPEFFDDLYMRITHTDLPRSRRLYPVTESDGRTYWILTRGR